ncbi:MAG TPA: hypothetical protein VHB21_24270, partial [Minicystis sp.]|nr:hypothetical protein [Minicystis sp.]
MTATTNERVVFSSRRGGSGTGRGVYVVFGVLLFWFPLVGALTDVVENAAGRVGVELLWLVALGAVATLLFGWIALFVGPICVVTDRRFVGRRYLRPRVDVPAAELAGAQRVVVQIRRGMEVVREQHTHLVAVVLRSGRVVRVGPVRDAEGLVALVRQIGSGEVDPRALRGVAGEPSRAEERGDLFFATQAATGGAPRGPLFVGPTAVVG